MGLWAPLRNKQCRVSGDQRFRTSGSYSSIRVFGDEVMIGIQKIQYKNQTVD